MSTSAVPAAVVYLPGHKKLPTRAQRGRRPAASNSPKLCDMERGVWYHSQAPVATGPYQAVRVGGCEATAFQLPGGQKA